MKFIKNNLLLIIVDVLASTEAFVGMICLITIHRSVSGQTGCRRSGRVTLWESWQDERSYQLSYIYDNLFAPKLSGEQRLDRPFRQRVQSRPKRQQ